MFPFTPHDLSFSSDPVCLQRNVRDNKLPHCNSFTILREHRLKEGYILVPVPVWSDPGTLLVHIHGLFTVRDVFALNKERRVPIIETWGRDQKEG